MGPAVAEPSLRCKRLVQYSKRFLYPHSRWPFLLDQYVLTFLIMTFFHLTARNLFHTAAAQASTAAACSKKRQLVPNSAKLRAVACVFADRFS